MVNPRLEYEVMSAQNPYKSAMELLGVPDKARRGRERLIVTAIELFYRCGFNAVGLDAVLAKAGVSKTTFYKHFESKDALMVAAIERRDQWETRAWDKAVTEIAGDDPLARLRALFEVMDVWFNDPDFGGCLFINAASEFPNPNDPVHQAAARHKRAGGEQACELARRAGASDPQAFADAYVLLVEGTLILRQVHGRNDAARLALKVLDQLIGIYIDAPGSTVGPSDSAPVNPSG